MKFLKSLAQNYWGAIFFLVSRWGMILYSFAIMGQPRLGDDALLYLSKGVGFYSGYSHGSNMQKSLQNSVELLERQGANVLSEEKTLNGVWRLSNQVAGGATFSFDILSGAIYKLLSNAKASFAVMEGFVSLVMAIGFFYFISIFWGYFIANISLVLLGFMLFPSQGIHYMIPSTLALALGFILVAYSTYGKKTSVVFLLSLYLSFLHSVAAVWIVASVIIVLFRLLVARNLSVSSSINKNTASRLLAVLLLPLILKKIIVTSVPYFSVPYNNYIPDYPGLVAIVLKNMERFWLYFKAMSTVQVVIIALCLFSVGVGFFRKKRQQIIALDTLLMALFIAIFLASFFVYVPYYPAEVSIRMFTAIAVFLLPYGVYFCVDLYKRKKILRGPVVLFFLTSIFMLGSQYFAYAYENTQRPYITKDKEFTDMIDRVRSRDVDLLLLETEYSLRMSSLVGADDLTYNFFPIFPKSEISRIIHGRGQVIVFPVFRYLVVAEYFRDPFFRIRENAIDLTLIDSLHVQGGSWRRIEYVIRSVREGSIFHYVDDKQQAHKRYLKKDETVVVDSLAVSKVLVEKGKLVLVGFREQGSASQGWPWGQEVILHIKTRPISKPDYLNYDFSLKNILSSYNAENLLPYIDHIKVLGDQSGFVFADVVWKK